MTQTTTPATLITEDGWELPMPDGTGENPWTSVQWPESLQIAVVREEGDPDVQVDNTEVIAAIIEAQRGDSGSGCAASGGAWQGSATSLFGWPAPSLEPRLGYHPGYSFKKQYDLTRPVASRFLRRMD